MWKFALSCSKIGSGLSYKPVSVDEDLHGARTAVPGDCIVHPSWRYLSNAPVAYQVQKVTEVCYFFLYCCHFGFSVVIDSMC